MFRLTAPWLSLPALQHLFNLFEEKSATLRLVGGSVRDGLLGLPVNDIDLAVDREPEWVMNLLCQNQIKTIPTGISHGTVTAIVDKRPFQITTLRVDVKTFGRKAHVAFTEDWVQDALRRDFTMNAIYADKHGHLFDPVRGLEDLKSQQVKFIGDASLRINEDYLRILRFFRFSARFGHEPYDKQGLEACTHYASHLPHLARERVTEEFLKLLELPSPLYTLESMNETGVLTYILHPGRWDDLKSLVALEKATCVAPNPLLRLSAFHPLLEEVKTHLRLSKKQESTLAFFMKNHRNVTIETFKHQAYLWKKERTFDLALLQTARRLTASEISLEEGALYIKKLHQLFESWLIPSFPLTGEDLLSRGLKEGHDIGRILKSVETWWISQELKPDRKACLNYLSTLL
ncbi:MAG: CCA tRNA nucleotidyltransferase [Alphaproteobacteria bacterium]|nr:CCA tRNA nucleotidyltransferase [Alphaproteobacteria bacterium]